MYVSTLRDLFATVMLHCCSYSIIIFSLICYCSIVADAFTVAVMGS